MTWRLGPVDQRTGGGRPPSTGALALPWPSGRAWLLGLLGLVAGALVLLSGPVPAASAADSCANAQYRTGASAALPDCRAYEMVTPADKDGASIQETQTGSGGPSLGYPSRDGNHFSVGAVPPFAGAKTGSSGTYVSSRSSDGWTTWNAQPAGCRDVYRNGAIFSFPHFSADFSTVFFTASAMQNCAPGDEDGSDVYSTDGPGSLKWQSTNDAPRTGSVARNYVDNSANGRHLLFATSEKLVQPLESGRVTGNGLYDRTDGRLIVVGLRSDGSLINPCGATGAVGQGAVSSDGRVILFTSGSSLSVPGCSPTTDDGGQLYARIDATTTVEISRSVATTPDPAGRQLPTFLGATRDGTRIFFRSGEALTDDAPAGGGLYEYDLAPVLAGTSTVGTLRLVGAGPGDNNFGIALRGLSDDGSVVYFVSQADLAPGATAGSYNLYVTTDGGAPTLVTTMAGYGSPVTVSSNGSAAAFLDTAPDGTTQVYRYVLGGSGVACVSCPPSRPAAGSASFGKLRRPESLGFQRFVTDDGRVFFNSPDRLAPRDTNDLYDVYEYVDGRQRLISSGTGVQDALLMGTSDDGRDVFFATNDSLVAQDFDNGDQDIYDARVGGGFPAPPAKPQPCVEACQPAVPGPLLAAPGSMAFAAPFVPTSRTVPEVKRKKISVKQPKTVRGTRVRLSVQAPEPGQIRVSGSGLKRAKRTAKKAKTYRVTVKLSKRSKRMLKRKHRLKVRATVRFTPKHGKRSRVRVHVTFKAKKRPHKGSRRSRERTHEAGRKGGR